MDKNMILAAVKTWRLLHKSAKVHMYTKKPSTLTITFTAGDHALISRVLSECLENSNK